MMRRVLFVAGVLVAGVACSRAEYVTEPAPPLPRPVVDTEILEDATFVEYVDVDLDGDVDAIRRYEVLDDEGEPLTEVADVASSDRESMRQVSKDLDVNGDLQMDVFRFYSANGELVREELDVDFDGVVDRVQHFDGATVTHKESDDDGDGVADTVRYYRGGALFRIEVDADEDGTAETYYYYDERGLHRRGEDTNEDGAIDEWTRRAAALAPAGVEGASAAEADAPEGSGEASEDPAE